MNRIVIICCSMFVLAGACEIMPRNSLRDCREQCKDSKKSKACFEFCDCIHNAGQPLDSCLDKYEKAAVDTSLVK